MLRNIVSSCRLFSLAENSSLQSIYIASVEMGILIAELLWPPIYTDQTVTTHFSFDVSNTLCSIPSGALDGVQLFVRIP